MTDVVQSHQGRPLVTFVLLAYNQEKFIREAVEGAFSQTYEPLEIILSDDCSSDRTFEIMAEMAASYAGPHKVELRKNEMNLGLAGHINVVVRSSSGEFIVWAAGDDISLPCRTDCIMDIFRKNDDVMGVHSCAINIDVDGVIKGQRSRDDGETIALIDVCKSEKSIVSQTHGFRRIVFDTFGDFHPELTNEGPPMTFRELLLGKIEYIRKPTIYYRLGSGVSTYCGDDVNIKQFREPIKISNWRRTAFRQMRRDSILFRDEIPDSLHSAISRKLEYYENLHQLNLGNFGIKAVFRNMWIQPFRIETIRAFLRLKCPPRIYATMTSGRN